MSKIEASGCAQRRVSGRGMGRCILVLLAVLLFSGVASASYPAPFGNWTSYTESPDVSYVYWAEPSEVYPDGIQYLGYYGNYPGVRANLSQTVTFTKDTEVRVYFHLGAAWGIYNSEYYINDALIISAGIDGSGDKSFLIIYPAGTYNTTLSFTHVGGGCSCTVQHLIRILDYSLYPILTPFNNKTNSGALELIILNGENILFSANSDRNVTLWNWYKNGVLQSATYSNDTYSEFSTSFDDAGGTITVSAENNNGVSEETTWNVGVRPVLTSWSNNYTSNNILNLSIEPIEINFNASANQILTTWNWCKNGVLQDNNYDNLTTIFNGSTEQRGYSFSYNDTTAWGTQTGTAYSSACGLKEVNDATTTNRLLQNITNIIGTWEFNHSVDVADNQFSSYLLFGSDYQNGYTVTFYHVSNEMYIGKLVDGVFSSILVINDYPFDTESHRVKVTRNESGGFELFFDGVSKGTVTDTTFTSGTVTGFIETFGSPATATWNNIITPDTITTTNQQLVVYGSNSNGNTLNSVVWNIIPLTVTTISCPIGWCYVASNYSSKTLLELDNLFSTDTVQGHYNATSQKYESHRTNYAFNQNVTVSQKEGYYYYFSSATDITTTPGSTPSITLKTGWNLVANYGTSARTLSALNTSIGANATQAQYYNKTTKAWVSTGTQSVPSMESFMVYVTSQTDWSG